MSNLSNFQPLAQRFNAVQPFFSSGTFTAPPGVTQAMVLVWGGGGGGGAGNGTISSSASGGGGGGFAMGLVEVTPGTSYTVTIGAGGNGNYGGTTRLATSGGTSSFGAFLTATGGSLATGGSTTGGAGGTGSAAGTQWAVTYSGGRGGDRDTLGSPGYCLGGGGGGSGSPYGQGGRGGFANANGRQYVSGTGGGGWVGNGGGNNYYGNITSSLNWGADGTGGGGLFDALDSQSGGGGGSHGYPQVVGSPTGRRFQLGQNYQAAGASMGFKGGGSDYFGFVGTSNDAGSYNANLAVQSKGYEPESYFDIVNCSLKGAGGYGFNVEVDSRYGSAGNGGPGSGGGGCYSVNTGVRLMGGTGGTGGGGGGASIGSTSGTSFGGSGGFGGGGGGAATPGGTATQVLGGKGGVGGGGGGGASHAGPGATEVTAGSGGSGVVMVFWKG